MLELGLIGHPLHQSISPYLHSYFLDDICYRLYDLNKEEVEAFLKKKSFHGLNVTVPYKETVIPYLDEIDETAKKIGAVNTIVNQDGKLIGYNTDYLGFYEMVKHSDLEVYGKHVGILGTGGASKAVKAALEKLGCTYEFVSRSKKDACITYDVLYEKEDTFEILVNTTPVGMVPSHNVPVDLERFSKLEAVIDVVANPLRTSLLCKAKCMGLKTLGGIEMLVRQAFLADELFTRTRLDENRIDACLKEVLNNTRNIVLIGMPGCGKTSTAKELGILLNREVVDMDEWIESMHQIDIPSFIETNGVDTFRQLEIDCAKTLCHKQGLIIACGGGVIERYESIEYLMENGLVIYLMRDVEKLAMNDRPLSNTVGKRKEVYKRRKDLYNMYADVLVSDQGSPLKNAMYISNLL